MENPVEVHEPVTLTTLPELIDRLPLVVYICYYAAYDHIQPVIGTV